VSASELALAAPLALVALPVAALLVAARPRRPLARIIAVLASLLAVLWLTGAGDLPDQVVRTAAVLTTAAFVVATVRTEWTVTHRALLAVGVAAAGIALGFVVFGWSWDRLHWWVAFRTGPALRLLLTVMTVTAPGTTSVDLERPDFDATLDSLVRASADVFPATLALQLVVCLVLAAAIAPRLAGAPIGRPLGRLVDFRFSEHLGWLLVAGVLLVLVPQVGGRSLGLNLLVVMGALYGFRGFAVLMAGVRAIGGGPILYAAAIVAVFLLAPGLVLLGVLDTGLNLRRRRTPPSGA
jgi:hypothetical protein